MMIGRFMRCLSVMGILVSEAVVGSDRDAGKRTFWHAQIWGGITRPAVTSGKRSLS
jgi:hypothetical protein